MTNCTDEYYAKLRKAVVAIRDPMDDGKDWRSMLEEDDVLFILKHVERDLAERSAGQ